MFNRMFPLLAVVAALVLAGCASTGANSGGGSGVNAGTAQAPGAPSTGPSPAEAFGPGSQWVETSLFFGLEGAGGVNLTSEQWNDFLDEVVTPRFPDGLTVLAGRGQYTNKAGKLVKENCRVIVIYHPPSAKAERAIEEIRAAYRTKMQQEMVLRVTMPAKVSF